jgi:hypothetical protein
MSLQENPNDGESIAEATLSDRVALVHGRLPPTNDFSVGIGHLNHAAAGRDVKTSPRLVTYSKTRISAGLTDIHKSV